MMMRTKIVTALTALLAAGVVHAHGDAKHAPQKREAPQAKAEQTPFGIAGDADRARRTVTIDMRDTMRFVPESLTVKRGDTVRIVVSNAGKVLHELVLGRPDDLKKHAALMRKFPGMEHDEPHMVHVAPGKSGAIVWQFNRAGEFRYGCLIPGHFEAGMVGRIRVID